MKKRGKFLIIFAIVTLCIILIESINIFRNQIYNFEYNKSRIERLSVLSKYLLNKNSLKGNNVENTNEIKSEYEKLKQNKYVIEFENDIETQKINFDNDIDEYITAKTFLIYRNFDTAENAKYAFFFSLTFIALALSLVIFLATEMKFSSIKDFIKNSIIIASLIVALVYFWSIIPALFGLLNPTFKIYIENLNNDNYFGFGFIKCLLVYIMWLVINVCTNFKKIKA